MPMLGHKPWTMDGRFYIRSSLAVERGMQVFATTKDGGRLLGIDWIGNLHPEFMEQGCDTFVLNPVDYEATKKSMMETPRRDRARDMRKRGYKDLQGFDPMKIVRASLAEYEERMRKQT